MEQPELRVVVDQGGYPTNAADLAQALAQMLGVDIRRIVHAVGTGDCTWYELASAILSAMGRQIPVHPITIAEAGRRIVRATYSVLANCGLKSFGVTLPHWNETLNRFIKNRETCAPASV